MNSSIKFTRKQQVSSRRAWPVSLNDSVTAHRKTAEFLFPIRKNNKARLKSGSVLRADGISLVVNTFLAASFFSLAALFNALKESCLLAESYYRAEIRLFQRRGI